LSVKKSGNPVLLFHRNRPPPAVNKAGQPKPPGPPPTQSADEIEQRKKLAERARRFAGPPPPPAAKSQSNTVKLGSKRPSDQGLDADLQSTAKQMRLLASRKVVAKAKATAVVQQRLYLVQVRLLSFTARLALF